MNVRPEGTYIDATFGRGGHARALLAKLGSDGHLITFDRDPDAISSAKALANDDSRLEVIHAPFSQLPMACQQRKGQIDGILFDLGISSPQVDEPHRGFSFRSDGPLDMRMDPSSGMSAAEWLNSAAEKEISDVLWQLGEERRSRQIAKRIVDSRREKPLTTTRDLAELVRSCVFSRGSKIDPATRTFQAVRLKVNDELGELERTLQPAIELLGLGGRVLVIAFHSLEDRFVKRAFRDLDKCYRDGLKDGVEVAPAFRLLQRKPWQVSDDEQRRNPRARSARLRVLERVA